MACFSSIDSREAKDLLEKRFSLRYIDDYNMDHLSTCKGIYVHFDKITKEIIDYFMPPNVTLADGPKFIATPCTGIDHIDVEYARNLGITIIHLDTTDECTKKFLFERVHSTAEHTAALMLAIARNLGQNNDTMIGTQLHDKTVGIIGLGRIGKQFARICRGFGMKLVGYDKIETTRFRNLRFVRIRSVLDNSDIVSIHVPLKDNEGLVDNSFIARMKPGSILLNTSRGGIINEETLRTICSPNAIEGLENIHRRVKLGLDFIDCYSDSTKKLLLDYVNNGNGFITDHIGGHTIEARRLTDDFIAKMILEFCWFCY